MLHINTKVLQLSDVGMLTTDLKLAMWEGWWFGWNCGDGVVILCVTCRWWCLVSSSSLLSLQMVYLVRSWADLEKSRTFCQALARPENSWRRRRRRDDVKTLSEWKRVKVYKMYRKTPMKWLVHIYEKFFFFCRPVKKETWRFQGGGARKMLTIMNENPK